MVGIVAQEELGGLAWLPDSRHLMVGSRFGDPASGGPVRTRLLIVDAGVDGGVDAGIDGGEQLNPRPVELIVVPAEALMESVVWSPDARRVAVILRAPAAPGAKRLVGLGVVDVSQPAESSFQYVADLGPSDSPAGRLPVAPVAWEPCQMADGCAAEQRLAYTAPVLNTAQAAAGPLSFLGLGRAPSNTPGGLYVSTLGAATLAIGDAPRVGSATGIIGLAWRSLGPGVNGATLVGLARGAGNTLALRAIDATTGGVQDLGVQLPPEVAAGSGAVGVRWDTLHARALVVARSSDRAIAGTEAVDVWLVDFSATSAEAR
jgi:hypothetical protein